MLKASLVLCCAALLVSGPAVGAARARSDTKVTLRIFDPKGRISARVTLGGIVRSQTRTIRLPSDPSGVGELSLAFTKAGRRSFCSLTRGLAHVGARRQQLQADALEVDGRIYSRGYAERLEDQAGVGPVLHDAHHGPQTHPSKPKPAPVTQGVIPEHWLGSASSAQTGRQRQRQAMLPARARSTASARSALLSIGLLETS